MVISHCIPLTLVDDTANELDHERDDLVIGKVLLPHEVIPGAEVKRMSQYCEQPGVLPALCAPSPGQSIAHPLQVDKVRLQNALHRRQIGQVACCGELHVFSALVVGIDLGEGYSQARLWIGHLHPVCWLRKGIGGQKMTGASGEEGLLIREMTIDGEPLDSRLFSNRADAGVRWSKRFMQMHGSLDNALPRLILLLRASFELIGSCHSSI